MEATGIINHHKTAIVIRSHRYHHTGSLAVSEAKCIDAGTSVSSRNSAAAPWRIFFHVIETFPAWFLLLHAIDSRVRNACLALQLAVCRYLRAHKDCEMYPFFTVIRVAATAAVGRACLHPRRDGFINVCLNPNLHMVVRHTPQMEQ